MVAAEQVAIQPVAHKHFGGLEHLRLGAAKAVNTLFGVAHNEHAGRLAPGPGVAAEPGPQRLPLQRVGVLKLVNQQVFDARIQALLHPARQHRVAQQNQGGALDIVHVDPAVLAFQR